MQSDTMIEKFAVCEDLQDIWNELVVFLKDIGFDRVIFARRDNLSENNFHNLDNIVCFSTYGEKLDQIFIGNRMYINSPTVQWALINSGWISWGETAAKYNDKRLGPNEEGVYVLMRNLGIRAGYTYSVPFKEGARYRSVFGLAVPVSETQAHADALFSRFKRPIETVLLAFVLAVGKFIKIEDGQQLTAVQIRTLSLLAEGRTLAEIAEREKVHYRTIDKRLSEARRILAANNSLHAVVLAERSGQLTIIRE